MAQRTSLLPDRQLLEEIHDTAVALRREISHTDALGRLLDDAVRERWASVSRADLIHRLSSLEGEAASLREQRDLWEARTVNLEAETVVQRALLQAVLQATPETLPAIQQQIDDFMRKV